MTSKFAEDVSILKRDLAQLPQEWEGKASVLTLKAARYNAGQTEWWAFFFEHLCFQALRQDFTAPGDKFGRTKFDMKRSVNWDLKAKAIKSDDHRAILNDKSAMQASIQQYGEHGLVVALCDVVYNDNDRTFEKWHTEIKGGKSRYTKERELRTAHRTCRPSSGSPSRTRSSGTRRTSAGRSTSRGVTLLGEDLTAQTQQQTCRQRNRLCSSIHVRFSYWNCPSSPATCRRERRIPITPAKWNININKRPFLVTVQVFYFLGNISIYGCQLTPVNA